MNIASLSKGSGIEDQKSKIGFNAEVFATIPLAESFKHSTGDFIQSVGS